MADYTFTFHDVGKEYNPAWLAPEGKHTFVFVHTQSVTVSKLVLINFTWYNHFLNYYSTSA